MYTLPTRVHFSVHSTYQGALECTLYLPGYTLVHTLPTRVHFSVHSTYQGTLLCTLYLPGYTFVYYSLPTRVHFSVLLSTYQGTRLCIVLSARVHLSVHFTYQGSLYCTLYLPWYTLVYTLPTRVHFSVLLSTYRGTLSCTLYIPGYTLVHSTYQGTL